MPTFPSFCDFCEVWTCSGFVHVVIVSISSCMLSCYQSCCMWKTLVFLESLTMGSDNLSTLLLYRSLSFEERNLNTFHLGRSTPKSLPLSILSICWFLLEVEWCSTYGNGSMPWGHILFQRVPCLTRECISFQGKVSFKVLHLFPRNPTDILWDQVLLE